MFVSVCKTDALAQGAAAKFDVGGQAIVLFHLTDGYFATQRRCPHMFAPLDRGSVVDGKVVCPLHKASFDIRTGAVKNWACWPKGIQLLDFIRPSKDLKTFLVKVEGGQVWVDV